jgi:methylthioribose-1-phosphate isomerase
VTPAALVTGLITERGVTSPVDTDGVRRLFGS